ncbi:[FeFe] hydrogenase H-cluster radical SAM maturase HydG [Scatolibacter rhodanostii]|uniref:[FeFe] hydrogenase H-cluster radical SAM maturase HydG n=1 Tax=Scatolibacter rhodanostii TaxID=2014781 RepID=UPI000C06C568|nr:[FeFe] hydrogenase H-cluster radical SAM maturase HydG [Scatolibacter rhodanostii]
MFIDKDYIENLLIEAKNVPDSEIDSILDKADEFAGLTHQEVAALLVNENPAYLERIFKIAGKIKEHIYGDRIVMFAPLYVSDYCVNQCAYCGYRCTTKFERRKLTQDEIREEVRILEQMGHKRIALEAGEDDENCPIDYILECLKTIYDMKFENGAIRRANVNIAATTVENFQKLHDAGIGTYILFQETYHQPTYEKMHISGPKHNYEYHLTAFDRAMQGGIDDVGAGVLFGLYEPFFEVLGLMIHNEHLEEKFGVGFHTISVPRLCKTKEMTLDGFKHLVDDDTFLKIVAIIRLAVPFTGMILSTREDHDMRKKLLKTGISQLSAGSSTDVGGYNKRENQQSQFEINDDRTAGEIIEELLDDSYVPSFCTACYRSGRTGDRFMSLAKSGQIKNVCLPNALMTLYEYAVDYGNETFLQKSEKVIHQQIQNIGNETIRRKVTENLEKIKVGKRDLYL